MEKPIDYSKPLKNAKHERFSQEYIVQLNATDSYKTAYPKCSAETARINGCKLLTNANVACRILYLQAELSKASGVTAKMLIDEYKKIGFANIKKYVNYSNKIKDISQLPDEIAAAIESIATTKTGLKITLHNKITALQDMGKHTGFFGKDNAQRQQPPQTLVVYKPEGADEPKK